MSKKIDLTGKNFGRLTVLKDSGKRSRKGDILWECICECGRLSFVRGYQLKRGTTKSCGCLARELAAKRGKDAKIQEALKEKYVEGTLLTALKQKMRSDNTSGIKGVSWDKKNQKWEANIHFRGKKIRLGRFIEKQDAIGARKEAEEKYFEPILEKYKT